jgi:hypothetical protein
MIAIRGLLLVVDFSTTILAGGHNLFKYCYNARGGADLQLRRMAFTPDPFEFSAGTERPVVALNGL